MYYSSLCFGQVFHFVYMFDIGLVLCARSLVLMSLCCDWSERLSLYCVVCTVKPCQFSRDYAKETL